MLRRTLLATTLLAAMPLIGVQAQTIYPIDRAEILSGSRFDLKVEFPGIVPADKIKVTLNGRDVAQATGRPVEYLEREDGQPASSILLRDVTLASPGIQVVTATDGTSTKSVSWEVYRSSARVAKNVILFVGDGMSVANVTAARLLKGEIAEGKVRRPLAMDSLPHMAMVGTAGSDSIVTDSANSASAYNTGHKSAVNGLGVYASRAKDNLAHPRQETLGSLAKRNGIAVGIVSDAEIQDATPAAVIANTRRRSDYVAITDQMLSVGPDVILGGGSASFLPKSTPGSRRPDERDMIAIYQQQGYAVATSLAELEAVAQSDSQKLLGLFHLGNMDTPLDRFYTKAATVPRFPDQPDLTDMTRIALRRLERNPGGFYLMVESALIDKMNHPMDWERAIWSTIMLDNAVKLAQDWAQGRNDTLIIVVPDHTHGVSLTGTFDDDKPGDLREKLGIYEAAGFPNYPAPDARGYPPRFDVSRRLALFANNFPDYYETGRPVQEAPRTPAVAGPTAGQYVANEAYRNVPNATLRTGNLPRSSSTAVHSGDDVVLRAQGPGSEKFHGYIDNTRVFRTMVEALGLGVD